MPRADSISPCATQSWFEIHTKALLWWNDMKTLPGMNFSEKLWTAKESMSTNSTPASWSAVNACSYVELDCKQSSQSVPASQAPLLLMARGQHVVRCSNAFPQTGQQQMSSPGRVQLQPGHTAGNHPVSGLQGCAGDKPCPVVSTAEPYRPNEQGVTCQARHHVSWTSIADGP